MANGSVKQGGGPEALQYAYAAAPDVGEAIEVAPGVHWIRLPLPFPPSHINTWALEGREGWTIVDTGLRSDETVSAWEKVFEGPLTGKPVARVLCTHMHPDHTGMAGWLTRRWNCRLWMTGLEYFCCRAHVADTQRDPPEDGVRFFHAAGLDDAASVYSQRFGPYRSGIYAVPDSYQRLRNGDELEMAGASWRVVVGAGHSPEHACLYCESLKLFISGDQVLPRYWANVTVIPTEPDANPLADWIEALVRIRRTVPADVLVLPSHGEPFRGLHSRLDVLVRGHEEALLRLVQSLAEPKRAIDVLDTLFRWPIRGYTMLGIAVGESLAHLNWLVRRGMAVKRTDPNGVDWYRATPFGSAQASIQWDSDSRSCAESEVVRRTSDSGH